MTATLDLTNKKFNRWKVLCRNGSRGGKAAWLCRCRCGVVKTVVGTTLIDNSSKSCGCLKSEESASRVGKKNPSYKHGRTKSREFTIWQSMIGRCYNKKNRNYPFYGGRGIRVCVRWQKSFLSFLEDMGDAPPGKTLGRKNNNGGYTPKNCRWETAKQQNRNRPNYNRTISFQGKSQSVAEWAEQTGLSYATIWQRHNNGWSPDRIFSQAQKTRNT